MNQVKSMLNPVCSVIQSNKSMLSMLLVITIVFLELPIDRLLKTQIQTSLVNNVKNTLGLVLKIVVPTLLVCLYFNGDVMNIALLSYVWAVHLKM